MYAIRRMRPRPIVFLPGPVKLHVSWINSRAIPEKDISPIITDDMKTLNRAWSVHPMVYRQLRKDILMKPSYMDNLVVSSKINIAEGKLWKKINLLDDAMVADADWDELQRMLRQLTNSPRKDQIHNAQVLERQCCLRLWKLDIGQMLKIMDAFYVSECRVPMFYNSVFHVIDLKSSKLELSSHNIVQLLFYISLYRNCPISLMRTLEELIMKNIDQFSSNELGFICHSFFAVNVSINNFNLVQEISERSMQALKTRTFLSYMVQNVCKSLRHAGYENEQFYQELGDSLSSKSDLNIKSQMAVLRTFCSAGFSHPTFCKKVLNRAAEMLRKDRTVFTLKELVSLVWGSVVFQRSCPTSISDVLMTVIEDNFKEISTKYPEKYTEALFVLVLIDKYPKRALSHALSQKYLAFKKERPLEQYFQMLFLDDVVGINCGSYKGNRMTKEFLASIPPEGLCDVKKQLEVRQGLGIVVSILQELLGEDRFVKCHNIFKFSKIPDIELHFTKSGEAIPFAPDQTVSLGTQKCREDEMSTSVIDKLTNGQGMASFNRDNPGDLNLKPKDVHSMDIKKVTVKVLGWNQYAINAPTLLGVHKYELELLQNQGYHVITVNPFHASRLEGLTRNDQRTFVREMIFEKILTDK